MPNFEALSALIFDTVLVVAQEKGISLQSLCFGSMFSLFFTLHVARDYQVALTSDTKKLAISSMLVFKTASVSTYLPAFAKRGF